MRDMTAVGYARRSKESNERTVSLEDQHARIAAYAEAQGWQLAEVVTDDGVSGGRRARLERLAERVRVTGARFVVIYHLDRFARDLAGTLRPRAPALATRSSSTRSAAVGSRPIPPVASS